MSGPEFLEVFVSLSCQIALLVLVAHGVNRFLKRESLKCRVWASCHVLILALAFRAFFFPRFWPIHPRFATGVSTHLEFAVWQERLGLALIAVWAAGAIASLALFLKNWIKVHRFLKACRPLENPARLSILKEQSLCVFPVDPGIQFLSSPHLRSPFCWQVHRPIIVLPEFVFEFDAAELRLIVRHELEHLRTGHPLTLFVQRVLEILFWFHPSVWWTSNQSAQAREFACDEAAVRSRNDVAHYLKSLLKIVEHADEDSNSQTVDLAFGRGQKLIARRANRLVMRAKQGFVKAEPAPACRWPMPLQILSAGVIALLFWIPIDLTKSPRAAWSPWPTWSAAAFHAFGLSTRDYDIYDHRFQIHELLEEQQQGRAKLTE